MEKPALRIHYDVHTKGDGKSFLDYYGMNAFDEDLSKEYTSIIKTTPVGLGGGAYQFVIDFFTNHTLKDYCEIIMGYFLEKTIDATLDRLILKPLISAYKKLRALTDDSGMYARKEVLDIWRISIELKDTIVFIYSIYPQSIIENKDKILIQLAKSYKNLIVEGEIPSSITIPALYDEQNFGKGKPVYRAPLEIGEMIDTSDVKTYFKYWGLNYQYSHKTGVYDVEEERLVLGEYDFFVG